MRVVNIDSPVTRGMSQMNFNNLNVYRIYQLLTSADYATGFRVMRRT